MFVARGIIKLGNSSKVHKPYIAKIPVREGLLKFPKMENIPNTKIKSLLSNFSLNILGEWGRRANPKQ